jgi:peptide/nickel transport system substrate-binding protein
MWHIRQEAPHTPWEAEIDRLFRLQESTLDPQKRKQAMHQIQSIMAEELPLMFLVAPEVYAGISNRLRNVYVPPTGSVLWNIEEIWIAGETAQP